MKNLQKLRRVLGWSQFSLAKRSGVARWRISLIENGNSQPSAEEKAALDRAVDSGLREQGLQFAKKPTTQGKQASRLRRTA